MSWYTYYDFYEDNKHLIDELGILLIWVEETDINNKKEILYRIYKQQLIKIINNHSYKIKYNHTLTLEDLQQSIYQCSAYRKYYDKDKTPIERLKTHKIGMFQYIHVS